MIQAVAQDDILQMKALLLLWFSWWQWSIRRHFKRFLRDNTEQVTTMAIKVFYISICLKLNTEQNSYQSYTPVQYFYFKPCRLSMDISESSDVNLYPMEPATALEFQESTVKCVYLPFFFFLKKLFVRFIILNFPHNELHICICLSLYIAVKCRWRCLPLVRYVNECIITKYWGGR